MVFLLLLDCRWTKYHPLRRATVRPASYPTRGTFSTLLSLNDCKLSAKKNHTHTHKKTTPPDSSEEEQKQQQHRHSAISRRSETQGEYVLTFAWGSTWQPKTFPRPRGGGRRTKSKRKKIYIHTATWAPPAHKHPTDESQTRRNPANDIYLDWLKKANISFRCCHANR